jgi:hypothetical protein
MNDASFVYKPRPMQAVVEKIVEQAGLSKEFSRAKSLKKEFHLRVVNEPWVTLVIEVIHNGHVSVCHYVEQNGDLVCDPEMTFNPIGWRVRTFTQGFAGYFRTLPEGRYSPEFEEFAGMWATNLEEQGFTAEGVRYESLTHAEQLAKGKGVI